VNKAAAVRPRITSFSFASNMAFSTPSVRVMTEVETTPAREEPSATRVAIRIVESIKACGT
jgi:hypothetical protein